jgi:phage terminase large subunit GpA-like protein
MSYASATDVRREVARLARPPERIRVSEVAQRYLRVRTATGGTEPWSPEVAPYMVEPMDRLTSRRHEAVVFVGPARTGKTAGLLGWLAYIIRCDPSDAMVLHMTQDKAAKFSKKELRRLYRDSPELRDRLSRRAQDDNTFDKHHRAGNVLYIGWPSASQLSGETLKYMALTDYDRMPESVDGEGAPFQLAKKRTQTFLSRGMTYVETSPGFEVQDPKVDPCQRP